MLFLLLLTLSFGVRGQTPSNLRFNYHPIVRQYLEETSAAPTKQGPVVFPPSPSPPPQTLVVTTRPRANNSLPASSGISSVYRPYRPFVPVPYGDNKYDFKQPTLPPIYRALSDHANNNLIKVTRKNEVNIHRPKKEDYDYNDLSSKDDQNQKYAFSYTVRDHKTGDDFSHSQHSSGSATNGEYRVKLPDGRTQIVSYTADENGYKADVRYDNDINDVNANNGGNNAIKYDTFDKYNGNNAYTYNSDNNVGKNAIKYNPIDNNNNITIKAIVLLINSPFTKQNPNSYQQLDPPMMKSKIYLLKST
ncbi:probable serine/threonine-protein kinase clkA [Aricia agestis]|uniref:probable serine/threonine-protein kinase clkA n=1 Tax=Aricia agestis TaxID=91739 RepID=UPI001C206080|nr:probable serine/threonine-protein kinase clkA [Aricia agestis]